MLKGKFTIFAAILQGLFIVLFAVFVRYPMDYYDDYLSPSKTDNPDREASRKLSAAGREVAKRYPCKYGTSTLSMLTMQVSYWCNMSQVCFLRDCRYVSLNIKRYDAIRVSMKLHQGRRPI